MWISVLMSVILWGILFTAGLICARYAADWVYLNSTQRVVTIFCGVIAVIALVIISTTSVVPIG